MADLVSTATAYEQSGLWQQEMPCCPYCGSLHQEIRNGQAPPDGMLICANPNCRCLAPKQWWLSGMPST